jgi:hypothetical protein
VKYRKNAEQDGGFAAKYYALANEVKDMNLRLAAMDVSRRPPEVQSYLELG